VSCAGLVTSCADGVVPCAGVLRPCAGSDGVRGSRPRKIRERRKSSSNGTPGVLSAAPVGPSETWIGRGAFAPPPTLFARESGEALPLPGEPSLPLLAPERAGVSLPAPLFAPEPLGAAAVPLGTGTRRGKSSSDGVESITRRAVRSSTGRPDSSSLPNAVRGTRVTPRHAL
jgi:hypothetical protein